MLCLVIDTISSPLYSIVPVHLIYPVLIFRSCALMLAPALQGAISQEYGPEDQGALLGLLSALQTVTAFLGPLAFNTLLSYYTTPPRNDPGMIMFIAAGDFLLCTIFTFIVFAVARCRRTRFKEIN
jgi:hypothetical protein